MIDQRMVSHQMQFFQLLNEPWIPVVMTDGTLAEMSLKGVLADAHLVRQVVSELPTTTFALHRLLLAVLYRAIDVTGSPSDAWRRLWRMPQLPVIVDDYLESYRDRFDLLDPVQPFLQVADLATAKGDTSGLGKLIADVPNGHQYFTTRAGQSLKRVTYAEGARWLVHAMAFDISGIKSGALGDDRVRGGKGYPIGTGWTGSIGGILIEGQNLRETLLLNLVLGAEGSDLEPWSADDDLAVWERPPLTAAAVPEWLPAGPASVLTWPSRRLRLITDETAVTGVLICNGDPLGPQDRHRVEPMTGWRRSEPQEKKLGRYPVYMPRSHDPERSMWRGLETMLRQADRDKQGAQASPALPAATLDWVRSMVGRGLPAAFLLRTRAIGMSYGSQSSSTEEIVDDSLALHASLMSTADLQDAVFGAVKAAEAGVNAFGDLARNLTIAAGGDGEGERDRARQQGFFLLDAPFRYWLTELTSDTDTAAACFDWYRQASGVLRNAATELMRGLSPAAWAGRKSSLGRHVDAALAEIWFRVGLAKALPAETRPANEMKGSPKEAVR